MYFDQYIISAICTSQLAIGGGINTDAVGAEDAANMQTNLSNDWLGPKTAPDGSDLYQWMVNQGLIDPKTHLPQTGVNFTTNEIQAAIQAIANAEQNASGDDLTKLEAARQTWSSLSSEMGNVKDLQSSPITTMAQASSSDLQQDNSAISNSSSLGNGIADIAKIVGNLVPNIQ